MFHFRTKGTSNARASRFRVKFVCAPHALVNFLCRPYNQLYKIYTESTNRRVASAYTKVNLFGALSAQTFPSVWNLHCARADENGLSKECRHIFVHQRMRFDKIQCDIGQCTRIVVTRTGSWFWNLFRTNRFGKTVYKSVISFYNLFWCYFSDCKLLLIICPHAW